MNNNKLNDFISIGLICGICGLPVAEYCLKHKEKMYHTHPDTTIKLQIPVPDSGTTSLSAYFENL